MATAADLIKADYICQGVVWKPPNGRTLYITPADRSNYSMPEDGRYRGKRQHVGVVIHTPEEPADDNEVTPKYFAKPGVRASTDAYTDNDGDLYGMVPSVGTAWAQGQPANRNRLLLGQRPTPDWMPRDGKGKLLSFNQMFSSNEVEGYAKSMKDSFIPEGPQYDTLASWIGWQMFKFGWEGLDRVWAHEWLDTWKGDPGQFVVDLFPKLYQAALMYLGDFKEQANRISKAEAGIPVETQDGRLADLESRLAHHDAAIADNLKAIKRLEKWAASAPR